MASFKVVAENGREVTIVAESAEETQHTFERPVLNEDDSPTGETEEIEAAIVVLTRTDGNQDCFTSPQSWEEL